MQSGELWERTTPVLRIEGKGSGYLPTPRALDWKGSMKPDAMANAALRGYGPNLAEWVGANRAANTPSGNWPTPTCSDAFTDKLKSDQQKEGSMHSVNLSQAVKMWPTPKCVMPNNLKSKGEVIGNRIHRPTGENFGLNLLDAVGGGQLNPLFVAYLMGWPLCWEDLKPLPRETFSAWQRAFRREPIASKPSETDKFPLPPPLHGLPSTNASKAAND